MRDFQIWISVTLTKLMHCCLNKLASKHGKRIAPFLYNLYKGRGMSELFFHSFKAFFFFFLC